MRFYLCRYVGSGVDGGSGFRPSGADDVPRWSAIDLRPDATVAQGWCLFATSDALAETADRRFLGDDPQAASAALKQTVESRLGVTLAANRLRPIIRELLIEHARTDGSRWRPLAAGHDRRFRVCLGDLVDEWPVVAGGATITESFTTADSDTLGPDLTWTEVTGDWDIVSNKASVQDGSLSVLRSARAEADLASADHYAQAVVVASVNASSCAGVAVRFDPSANTHYCMYKRQSGTANLLLKVVTGTKTQLATSDTPIADGSVLRLNVNGSSLESFDDGVSYLTATDSAITGHVRTGLVGGSSGGANRASLDTFEAGDLAAGGLSIPVAMHSYRRRRG